MQNAKDTFYEVLRQRLSTINPERAIALRGVVRPGLLVEENELVSAVHVPDCFRMSWSDVSVNPAGELPLVTMQCEFAYETGGSSTNGGMDRGRALETMNAELMTSLAANPMRAPKLNYAALTTGGAPAPMSTGLWWGNVVFGKVSVVGVRLARTAMVQVMSYQEEGEL